MRRSNVLSISSVSLYPTNIIRHAFLSLRSLAFQNLARTFNVLFLWWKGIYQKYKGKTNNLAVSLLARKIDAVITPLKILEALNMPS